MISQQKIHSLGHSVRQLQFHSLLRWVKTKISQVHPGVWGLIGGGSNIKITYQWLVYSFLGMSGLIYKIIKIFQNGIIIILLLYGILYKNSATNLRFRLLYDTQGLPCSIYKASTNMPTHSVTCGVTN